MFDVDIPVAKVNVANDPAVLVFLFPDDAHGPFVNLLGKGFLRLGSECLPLLRGVDSVEADLVLNLARVQDGQCVAVGDVLVRP